MIQNISIIEQIQKAAEGLRQSRPAYSAILDFYERLFLLQEDFRTRIKIEPITIPKEIVSIKIQEMMPLISVSDFIIDPESSEMLLKNMCQIARENPASAVVGETILNAVSSGKIELASVFSAFLSGNNGFLEQLAENIGIEKPVFVFFIYNSIQPSVTVCSEHLSSYLSDLDNIWGWCPVCGTSPELSILKNEGERSLFCGFCGHEWGVRRIFCPFCGNTDSKSLHYFSCETEREYRVDVCESCRKYLKTVDTRVMDRTFYAPFERVSTLHLDMIAKEKGLESGLPVL